jgi:hypothetical protein
MSAATPGQRGPIATETLSRLWLARLVRLGHAASVSCGCEVIKKPLSLNPSPHPMGRGNVFLCVLTQGGARSSLALGYYHVIPTGFHFGSLRSLEDERGG